jgi:hypothetical protein
MEVDLVFAQQFDCHELKEVENGHRRAHRFTPSTPCLAALERFWESLFRSTSMISLALWVPVPVLGTDIGRRNLSRTMALILLGSAAGVQGCTGARVATSEEVALGSLALSSPASWTGGPGSRGAVSTTCGWGPELLPWAASSRQTGQGGILPSCIDDGKKHDLGRRGCPSGGAGRDVG